MSLSEQQPSIWLLLGDKKGDNGQVETIAEALETSLGWHCELKRIKVLEPFVFGKAKVGPTLYHIDRERSDPLQPPWPDLVISTGRRTAPVARWIGGPRVFGPGSVIEFVGHPDLRRLFLPEDWEGHPLRKDAPVGSVPVQFKEPDAR